MPMSEPAMGFDTDAGPHEGSKICSKVSPLLTLRLSRLTNLWGRPCPAAGSAAVAAGSLLPLHVAKTLQMPKRAHDLRLAAAARPCPAGSSAITAGSAGATAAHDTARLAAPHHHTPWRHPCAQGAHSDSAGRRRRPAACAAARGPSAGGPALGGIAGKHKQTCTWQGCSACSAALQHQRLHCRAVAGNCTAAWHVAAALACLPAPPQALLPRCLQALQQAAVVRDFSLHVQHSRLQSPAAQQVRCLPDSGRRRAA